MNISDLFTSLGAGEVVGRCSVVLLVVFSLLQIAPIKINPWSWLGKKIGVVFSSLAARVGKAINEEVITELTGIKNRLSELEKHDQRQDEDRGEDKALDARRRVLQFADEIRRKVRHSEEHFNNAFEDIDYYRKYCDEHADFENDKARISIKIIEETYERCTRENDFL